MGGLFRLDLIKPFLYHANMNGFSALADPTRRQIVEMLAHRSLSSGEIASQFEMSAPAISQHLKVLREAKLVRAQVAAQRRIYELNPEGVDEIAAWVTKVKQFWNRKLDNLEHRMRKENESHE
jgi:DNA-binding transcriptional ArsR family regulator